MCIVTFFLAFVFLMVCPLDSFAKMYKWVDENGKITFSDTPPPKDKKVKDVKEYKSIENNDQDEELETPKDLSSSNVRISKIKTKVLKIKTHEAPSSEMGGSGRLSSGSEGQSRTAYSVLIRAEVASVDGYDGRVTVILQAVTRDGDEVKRVTLAGNVGPNKKTVLSQTMPMLRASYKKIYKWKILHVYTRSKKRK